MPTRHSLLRMFVPIAALAIMACTRDAPVAPDVATPRSAIDTAAADLSDEPLGTLNCQPGTIETDGACFYVPKGYYMPYTNYTYAFACPLPYTTSSTGSTSINQCLVEAPPGSYVSPDTHVITPCPAGQYTPYSGLDSCFFAPPGYYIPGTGATGYLACPSGTYSSAGAAACTPTPPGTYAPGFGNGSPTSCAPGTYQPGTGQSSCLPAPPGNYVPFSHATSAIPCSAGSYALGGNSSCLLAPAGYYIPGTGSAFYTPCAIGTYQPLTGKSSCLPAPIGSYVSFQGAASATPCPADATTTAAGATSSAQCVTRPLSLGDAQLWIGLKNSDDVGLRLDVRAEVLLDGVVVGSGELQDIAGGSSGFNNAVLRTIGLAMNGAVSVPAGAVLTFRPSVRRTCIGTGHKSGTVRFWFDGPAIDVGTTRNAGSRFAATVATASNDFFMRDPSILSTTAGTARQYVDVAVNSNAACPSRPYSPLGEWSVTQ